MIATQNYFKPKTCAEALQFAQAHAGDFCWLAGGTDVMLNRQQENNRAATLIDISGIDALCGVRQTNGQLHIGALTTLHELAKNPLILQTVPALAEAAKVVASPLIRYSATIGGNLLVENRCVSYNQSEFWKDAVNHCMKIGGEKCLVTGSLKHCFSQFVSDTAPALLCLQAEIELETTTGSRKMPLEKLYSGSGLAPRNIGQTEILKTIIIPAAAPSVRYFRKLSQRQAVDFTSLTCAMAVDAGQQITVALGGVHPGPVLLQTSLPCNAESLVRRALKSCKTVDNDMYARTYRREMIGVFIREGLGKIQGN